MRLLEDHIWIQPEVGCLLRLADLCHLLSHEGGSFNLQQVGLLRVYIAELLQKGQVLIEVSCQEEVVGCIPLVVTHLISLLRRSLIVGNAGHFDAPETIRVPGLNLEPLPSVLIWVSSEGVDR